MADIKLNTPKGTAVFPSLQRPDTKFDELGMYKADLSVPLSEAKGLMDNLGEIFKRHTGKAPNQSENTMWYKQTDKDTGEPIIGANVIIQDTYFGAAADIDGYYYINNII